MFMKYKNQIVVSLSFVIALCYSLPWLALIEKIRLQGFTGNTSSISQRVAFLFVSVFATCLILFYFNVTFRSKWSMLRRPMRVVANVGTNLILISIISAVMLVVVKALFNVGGVKAYLAIYLIRNFSIGVIVVLLVYVIELIEKLRAEKVEILMLRNQRTESQLAALRNQIDPHYLFNTLTTLSGLARTNSEDTVPFIDHMAETFRYMLENRENRTVTVRDELHFLESYVFTIRKRFDEGIHLDIQVDDKTMTRSVPQFALQIAVENAIKHNVVSLKKVLQIRIISRNDSISIINNLQKKKNQHGYGLGLQNLSQRYYLIAKKNISVKTDEGMFELNLPVL